MDEPDYRQGARDAIALIEQARAAPESVLSDAQIAAIRTIVREQMAAATDDITARVVQAIRAEHAVAVSQGGDR